MGFQLISFILKMVIYFIIYVYMKVFRDGVLGERKKPWGIWSKIYFSGVRSVAKEQ